MKTMTEVHVLLATNPASSVYKYGLSDRDVNILRVGRTGEDQVSRLVIDVLRDRCGSGGVVETPISIRPRIESPSTHGTGCTLSAAITCGLANGLKSDFSPPYFFLETNRYCSTPEAVRNESHPPQYV